MITDSPLPSWPVRLKAYLDERFKPGVTLLTTLMMVAAHGLAAIAVSGQSIPPWVYGRLGWVTAVLVLMFFHLRVFDEHKDREIDRVAYPHRVLSRGWVTLAQLRMLAAGALALEVGLSAIVGRPFLICTLGCIAYTVLMLREFGVGGWLRRHLFVYGLSHMAVLAGMVLGIHLSLVDLGAGYDPFAWPLLAFMAVGFAMVFSLEVARKVWHPEDEKQGVDSYSGRIGIPGSVATLVGFQFAALLMLTGVAAALHIRFSVLTVIWGAWCLATVVLGRGLQDARVSGYPRDLARRVEAVSALPVLVFNLSLIVNWGFLK